ncbi:MAG: hypothetical protein ACOC97_02880 [Myxococcota bacterium]
MDARKILGFAVLALGVGLGGCGDDGNGDGDGDAGTGNGGGATPLPEQLSKGEGGDAVYTCEPSAPPTGDSRTFTLAVEDFETGAPVPDVCVNFYGDNQVPVSDTCGGTTTDASGEIEVTDPDGSYYAYRIFEEAGTNVGVVQRNEEAPDEGGTAVGNSVSASTAGLIPGVLGVQQDPEDAIFAGTVVDCDGDVVEGAGMRVVRNGEIIPEGTGSTDARYEYFDGEEFPMQGRDSTNTDGLFIGVNIPIESQGEEVLAIACGKVDGTPELIGCEETRSFANTVNIINLGPVREDGPEGCAAAASLCAEAFE